MRRGSASEGGRTSRTRARPEGARSGRGPRPPPRQPGEARAPGLGRAPRARRHQAVRQVRRGGPTPARPAGPRSPHGTGRRGRGARPQALCRARQEAELHRAAQEGGACCARPAAMRGVLAEASLGGVLRERACRCLSWHGLTWRAVSVGSPGLGRVPLAVVLLLPRAG